MARPDEANKAEYLAFARTLAASARAIVRARMRSGFTAELKPDASFVTDVDTAVESAWRQAIAERYPEHGVIGEEFAATRPDADWQWILDPIDGTDNFAHGIPTFGSILALHHRGRPIVSLIDHPQLDLSYSAAAGLGAFRNGERMRIAPRDVRAPVARDIVCTTAAENFLATDDYALFAALHRAFPNTRVYRDCFGQTRAFEGSASAMVEYNVKQWDVAAAQLLVEEAGGVYVALPAPAGLYRAVFGRREAVDAILAVSRARGLQT